MNMDSGNVNESGYMDVVVEGGDVWTWEMNKKFENAFATYCYEIGDHWDRIAEELGVDVEDVKKHYRLLEEDIDAIEDDRVLLPSYLDDEVAEAGAHGKKGGDGKGRAEQERRKGIAWTEEEHRLFLLGLEKYGKGDWRSISRNFVISRTPTQVASHAQKYFIRLTPGTKDKRRSSIHDITSVNPTGEKVGPITGQYVPSPAQQTHQTPAGSPRVPSGPAIGRPVVGSHAVGTPVNYPLPRNSVAPPLVYRMPAPVTSNQVENAYPEQQMENAYLEIQMENAHPETPTKNTKNTFSKSNKRR
ncbi:transcription factor SRM1-like isoform X2 [Asparagus officinalis]|uniref:transcription factor SRM1-like isoform X1 n=1 Tax=Asparagus officinalis TaxID=4686 RepID=UPI00098DEE14|nr:transcription factor SRM1-like isoform X1 [Asparagus officinalis]XP_020241987.1 transcription factor SRM1-like isoform X2 [Asparagus officinalis]